MRMKGRMAVSALPMWMLLMIVGCTGSPSANSYADIPTNGDVTHGAAIFVSSVKDAPSCITCHRVDSITLVGPGLGGFATRAGSRVNGLSAREYAYQSIVSPARYMASGFSNLMYDQYGKKLEQQELADLLAYLMSL